MFFFRIDYNRTKLINQLAFNKFDMYFFLIDYITDVIKYTKLITPLDMNKFDMYFIGIYYSQCHRVHEINKPLGSVLYWNLL